MGRRANPLAEGQSEGKHLAMSIEVNPDAPFHVTRDGIVVAISLEQLDAAYQDDHIQDDTLIWQEGFEEWMRLDTLLHTLAEQDGSAAAPAQDVSDDVFHVLVAPEEVKQMSLDLLADAYRLEVIDDDTLVWQQGFTEWLPLSALLGPEDDHVSIAPSMPPAYNGGYAPPVSVPAQEAPAFNFGSLPAVEDSLAPAAVDLASLYPVQAHKTSPWYGRSLVGLGALCALFVSYRAGVFAPGAEGPEAGTLLASLESKVGAPGVDTTQGMDRWLGQLEKTHGLDSLSETKPVSETLKATATEPADKTEETKTQDTKDEDAETSETEEKKPEGKAEEKKSNATASAFSSSLSGKPAPAKTAAPARRPVRTSKPSSGTPWKGSQKGSAYDPMNGAL